MLDSRTDQPSAAPASALSWKGRYASTIGRFLQRETTGSTSFPRFLPLLYLAICIPTILFLAFYRQPLSNPDELSHISRAYQLSQGVILTEEAVPGEHPKGMVDKALFQLNGQVIKRRYESLRTALPVFQTYGWTGEKVLRRFNSSVYFPAVFVPQALGLKVAQILDLKLVQSFQLASLLNAAACVLMIALAIHLAPQGKFIIAFIGALPMTVHQLASSSPDGLLIAGSLLMFSLAVRAVVTSRVSTQALIAVVLLGAVIAATKLPYAGLGVAALAALWRAEPRTIRQSSIYILACIVMISIPILWLKVSNASAVNHHPHMQTDPGAQVAFLLSHPLDIPHLAWSTLHIYGRAYLMQIIGVLGWLDAYLPRFTYALLGLGLLATLAMDGVSVRPLLRWIVGAAIAASFGLIFASLYLTWNPLRSLEPIRGIQGRYFLPLLPFVAFLIPKLKRFELDHLKLWIFTSGGLISGGATVAAILRRYYT